MFLRNLLLLAVATATTTGISTNPTFCQEGASAIDAVVFDSASRAFFNGDYASAREQLLSNGGKKENAAKATSQDEASVVSQKKDPRSLINVGMCYLGLKEFGNALDWFTQARKLLDKNPASNPTDIADCWSGMAECHYMQGQFKTARHEYSEALSFLQQKFGQWHPETVPVLEGIAGCFYREGDYDKALALYLQAARIDLKTFGPTHPRLGLSFNNIAEVYYKLGDCGNSRKTFEQGLWIAKANSTERHIKQLRMRNADPEKMALMEKRIKDVIIGTVEPPAIAKVSIDLLKAEGFDPAIETFSKRPTDFANWRIPRRLPEDTLFVSLDPQVEQKGLIICLHGLGLHSKSFADFAEKINPYGYGVLALDVRGFGSFAMEKGLDQLDLNAGLEDMAASISLIRAQNPNLPIYVLGESMGGALALQLAAKYPEHVKALISAVPSGKRYKSAATGLLVGLNLLEDKRKPIEIGKKVIEQSTQDQSLRDVWMNDPGSRLSLSAEELLRFQEFMNQTVKLAKDIKSTPVIIFQGFKDHLVKAEGTMALYGALATKDKDLVMVGEAEHLIFEEGQAPQDIVAMLAAWLDAQAKKDRASTASVTISK